MTPGEIRRVLLRILGDIAPEADLGALRPDVPLRDQLDIDSMDLLSFVASVDKELHVDVPETDYAKIATLDGCADYVAARLGGVPSPTAP